jgi:G:T-mismatch repair DNA endonuclease (very short patch repair protein)
MAVCQFSNPAARLRASELQILAMANGKIAKVSVLEDRVAAVLDTMGVPYTRQAPIRCPTTGRYVACVDFLLGDGRILEVNGTYWHADPRVYPDGPRHISQKHTVGQYHIKETRLKAQGLRMLEVWEMDVNSDAIGAVKKALAGCR